MVVNRRWSVSVCVSMWVMLENVMFGVEKVKSRTNQNTSFCWCYSRTYLHVFLWIMGKMCESEREKTNFLDLLWQRVCHQAKHKHPQNIHQINFAMENFSCRLPARTMPTTTSYIWGTVFEIIQQRFHAPVQALLSALNCQRKKNIIRLISMFMKEIWTCNLRVIIICNTLCLLSSLYQLVNSEVTLSIPWWEFKISP